MDDVPHRRGPGRPRALGLALAFCSPAARGGLVAPDTFGSSDHGWAVGVQLETWW